MPGVFKLLLLLTYLLSAVAVSGRGLKKVLILDFKNIEGKESHSYLEPSITDAVKQALAKQFAYEGYPAESWREYAESNYFYPQDHHTESTAMQLGLQLNQDVAIGGGFTVSKGKIYTQVHIYDVGSRKLVSRFTVEGFADNRIFESVDKLAARVAEEAQAVLPNKNKFDAQGAPVDGSAYTPKAVIALHAGYPVFATQGQAAAAVNSKAVLNPYDFGESVLLNLSYERHDWLESTGLFVIINAGGLIAERDFTSGSTGETITGSSLQYWFANGVGRRFYFHKNFYTSAYTMLGYYGSMNTLDYSGLEEKPLSGSQTSVSERELSFHTLHNQSGLRFGMQLDTRTSAELGLEYHTLFFADEMKGRFSVQLGLGYYL